MEVKSINRVIDIMHKVVLFTLLIALIGCSSTKEETVSKKRYDELLTRYNKLKNKKDPSMAIDQIKIETVDVFAPARTVSSKEQTETDIDKLDLSEKYIAVGNFEKATGYLKQLENSGNRQVQVRAKFLMGEMYFTQKEYDLAMQIFEDIVKNYSFSGVVIKALGRLEACSKNLKQPEKQKVYHSMINDVFGS